MEYFDTLVQSVSPVSDYMREYFRELGSIFSDTVEHDIGLDVSRARFMDTATFLTALFSVLSPFVFFTAVSWCCSGKKKTKIEKEELGASDSDMFEAMRWYRQADYDLTAANSDLTYPGSYEWCCIKCQQAAEKAIKAAMYASGVMKHKTGFFGKSKPVNFHHHGIVEMASDVNDRLLKAIAVKLLGVTGTPSRLRYPDMHAYPNIPHNAYNEEHAASSVRLAAQVLEHVKDTYLAGTTFWQQEEQDHWDDHEGDGDH